MRLPHNVERRAPSSLYRSSHPYRGWSGKRGTLYYISRAADGKSWRAAPSLAMHDDEPPYFYARTLAAIGEKLASF